MKYVEDLNSSPIFKSIAENLDYERIGLQVLDKETLLQEFTSYNKNGKIVKVEEGLNEPDFTAKIDKRTLKEMVSNQKWIEENPLDAAMKYMGEIKVPFTIKIKLMKLISKI